LKSLLIVLTVCI